jgi:hypothetical protein
LSSELKVREIKIVEVEYTVVNAEWYILTFYGGGSGSVGGGNCCSEKLLV